MYSNWRSCRIPVTEYSSIAAHSCKISGEHSLSMNEILTAVAARQIAVVGASCANTSGKRLPRAEEPV